MRKSFSGMMSSIFTCERAARRPRRGQRLGDERIRGREGEGDDEGLHLFFNLRAAVGSNCAVGLAGGVLGASLGHVSV